MRQQAPLRRLPGRGRGPRQRRRRVRWQSDVLSAATPPPHRNPLPRKRGAREMFVCLGAKSFIAKRSRTGCSAAGHIAAGGSDIPAAIVTVMVAYPVGQIVVGASFVAPLGREIEIVISAEQYVTPARVARIGVEDISGLVFEKHADSGHFFALQG